MMRVACITLENSSLTKLQHFAECCYQWTPMSALRGSDTLFLDSSNIFEFTIITNPDNNSRTEARDIQLLDE